MVHTWRLAAIRRRRMPSAAHTHYSGTTTTTAAATALAARTRITPTATSSPLARYTSTSAAAAAPATATATPSDDPSSPSSSGYRYNPFNVRDGRIQIATPLPSDVQQAYRGAIKKGKTSSSSTPSSSSPTQQGNLAFGDFTGATLHSIRTNDSHFPPSQAAESLAILRACLGTNLLSRALKIFSDLRDDAARTIAPEDCEGLEHGKAPTVEQRLRWASYHSVDINTYNFVIAALFRRANAERNPRHARQWVDMAAAVFRDMETGRRSRLDPFAARSHADDDDGSGKAKKRKSPASSKSKTNSRGDPELSADPLPEESTVLVMAKGLIRNAQVHGEVASDQADLADLVASTWRLGLSFATVLRKTLDPSDKLADVGHVDAQTVAHRLLEAALSSGHDLARAAIEQADAQLQGHEGYQVPGNEVNIPNPSDEIPELIPVRTTSKAATGATTAAAAAASEPVEPLNLALLRKDLAVVHKAKRSIRDNEERQRWLEDSALDSARQRLKANHDHMQEIGLHGQTTLQNDRTLQKWMWEWVQALEKVLVPEIERLAQNLEGSSKKKVAGSSLIEDQILPFLKLIDPSKLALITVLEVMRLQGTGGVAEGMKTARTVITIGSAIEQEHYADVLRNNADAIRNGFYAAELVRQKSVTDMRARQEAKKWLEETNGGVETSQAWTQTIRARVGSFLVGHLMQVAKVRREARDRDGELWVEDQPAFYSTFQYLQGKKLGVIRLNEAVARRLDKDQVRETLHPRTLPMLVKPRLWLKEDEGGYLSHKISMMRFKESAEQSLYLKRASENNSLETVQAGLDVLGETPWIINRKMLEVITEVWNSGEEVGKMPPLLPDDFAELPRPDDYDTNLESRARYLIQVKQLRLEKASAHSMRCDTNYKLEIARAFVGEQFYFPHNIDFRGRAYPIPPHLNHIGNDLSRGLLLFAEARKLGQSGLRWLRIHLANVYGYDKASFAEREQFAKDHIADIEDSARNPLTGRRWWLKADDPWQCLATCMELDAALNHPEGPTEYESRLPVHQDGTCNGLQHYAALGGDLAGAKQVNLAGSDRPQDVYTAVADLVIEDLAKDAAAGDEMAKMLEGKITRKVVKQTVMTTVYGVTFIGAKNQVTKQLAARGDVPAEALWGAGSHLAKKIMKSIGTLFSGAEKIQEWLVASAKLIAKSVPPERVAFAINNVRPGPARVVKQQLKESRLEKEQMTSVIWTTPIGLPVVQPYRKSKKKQIATAMQTVFLSDPRATAEVAPAKQASAFPPNFIHSLDATHMILTALECRDAGLTFASVHDSYWTHACDVETMSELIRDTFVRLHTETILPKLREEFMERYKGYKVPVVVAEKFLQKRAAAAGGEGAETTTAATEEEQKKAKKALAGNAVVLDAETVARLPGTEGTLVLAGEDEVSDADAEAEAEADDPEALDAEFADAEADADADAAPSSRKKSTSKAKTTSKSASKSASKSKQPPTVSPEDAAAATSEAWVTAKFVELQDILPALPQKGGFDVNEIKRSEYFFS